MAIRTIRTEDFFGKLANFEILWETVCMTCTFAVGIQTDKPNELSIMYVTSMDGKDIYDILETVFLEDYYNDSLSLIEEVKKEMKRVIIKVLTARVKAGMITIEQIRKWAVNKSGQ